MFTHASRVIRTEGWLSLLQNCPEIANSVVAQLSKFHEENRNRTNSHAPRIDWGGMNEVLNPWAPPPANPEEEVLPVYPHIAVHHLDEDEADNQFHVLLPAD